MPKSAGGTTPLRCQPRWSPAGSRYVAQGRNLRARPHTVVTDDLAELAAALTAGQHTSRANNQQANTCVTSDLEPTLVDGQ